ncbi:MAG: urea amidolyase associated protein UAAP1 [Actinomycetota bacterium]
MSSTTPTDTATTHAARDHARAMSGTTVDTMPTMPPSAVPDPPVGVDPADVLWEETVAGGGYTQLAVARGSRIRLVDLAGDACAGVLVHRFGRTAERLNVADTVKVQWQAYPGEGSLLLSDMGRVLMSVRSAPVGVIDAICGTSNLRRNEERHGDGAADGPSPNGRDLFAVALGKRGMGRRDVAPNVNLFKRVRVAPDGSLQLTHLDAAGAEVLLVAEMDVVITIVDVPHPLDQRVPYSAGPLRVTAWRGEPTPGNDPIRTATPEAERAFLNTDAEVAMNDLLGGVR